jgi:hypothetical protein
LTGEGRGGESLELDALPQAGEQRDAIAQQHGSDVSVEFVDEPESGHCREMLPLRTLCHAALAAITGRLVVTGRGA